MIDDNKGVLLVVKLLLKNYFEYIVILFLFIILFVVLCEENV